MYSYLFYIKSAAQLSKVIAKIKKCMLLYGPSAYDTVTSLKQASAILDV